MKNWISAGIVTAALAAASTAFAADIARPVYKAPPVIAPVYNWTGFYIGGNAGYAWGNSDLASSFTCTGAVCPYNLGNNLAAIGLGATSSHSSNGFTGGVQAGYNWQSGVVVFGVESDFNAFNLGASIATNRSIPVGVGQSFTSGASYDTDWLFTLRGRLGWTVTPTMMVYGTGGWAVTNLQANNLFLDNCANFCGTPNFAAASSSSSNRNGWVVGAGIEWAVGGNWTARAEYLYIDFGSVTTVGLTNTAGALGFPNANALTTTVDLHANIVRAGLSYKFDYSKAPVVAKY